MGNVKLLLQDLEYRFRSIGIEDVQIILKEEESKIDLYINGHLIQLTLEEAVETWPSVVDNGEYLEITTYLNPGQVQRFKGVRLPLWNDAE